MDWPANRWGFKLLYILTMHLKGPINSAAFFGSSLKTANGTWQERSFKLAEQKHHELKTPSGCRTSFGGSLNITLMR